MYFLYLILLVALVFVVHSILPTYYNKIFNKDIVRTTGQANKIMLTFDDGPDDRYIHELLEVLDQNQVKASFFMVAENAQKNKMVVEKILGAGHRVMKDLGLDQMLYRPPWGHTNIFSNHFVKKYGMKMIYWDVMAEDWEAQASPESIRKKLLDRTGPTSIICLHDAGENSGGAVGAPKNTIEALRLAIPELKAKGYEFILP